MKKAAIVSIGNEILSGRTVDTNAAYLSRELLSVGMPVVSAYTVADDVDAIVRGLDLAAADSDLILATGGLGPTDDDVTRQAFAEFLCAELEFRGELLERMKSFFSARNVKMHEKNRRQAYIPAGADCLANNAGTAPGIIATADGRMLIALPGVPAEMKQMFAESVLPQVEQFASGQVVELGTLKCYGAGESTIAGILGELMQRGRNPLINCTPAFGVITLHIVATAGNRREAKRMIEEDEESLRSILGDLVYGTGEQTLAEVVGLELARRRKTIALAESCTGGLLAKLLTDIPGASNYLTHGWITYSNSAKATELGVSPDLIERHGAVSEQVARAMATGAREKAGADYAIGITGIAGPTGGTEQKPVGLVYIYVDSGQKSEVECCRFSGDRDSIRRRAAQTALNMLRLRFKD